MCGIIGFFDKNQIYTNDELNKIALNMANSIFHRGPDDGGVWTDDETGLAMGSRRLSIIDLTAEGAQPMACFRGRYVMVFNGEIYNFKQIRSELEALVPFRGRSDTEIFLNAVSLYGVETAVKNCVGMFAFAVFDRREKVLTLGRDRMGEKPLYYGWMGNTFLFGSELKALKAHPAWCGEIDRNSLALYLRHSYIPFPYSIYKKISKLLPGALLNLPLSSLKTGDTPSPRPFWSARDTVRQNMSNPFNGTDIEALGELEKLLRRSVKGQMISDVPLGAFISGGIDSSIMVALMQNQASEPVKTFTMGFEPEKYNEAGYAKAIANHLGTDHTEMYVTSGDAVDVISSLPDIYDEPFGDSSQIPTFLLSRLTREHVTVSLSGDGGDELFGGYDRYAFTADIWSKYRRIPDFFRAVMLKIAQKFPACLPSQGFRWLEPFLGVYGRGGKIEDKLRTLNEMLSSVESQQTLYHFVFSHWRNSGEVVINSREPRTALNDPAQWIEGLDFYHQMMYMDLITYLPDDILVKVDRASMGVSLECRVPFLDHRVVEFAWRLPLNMKIRNGKSKWLLKQLLYKYVPPKLVERPKMGFAVPMREWLGGALREWGESLLDERRLKNEGFFHPEPIRKKWREHISGENDWGAYLWDILMFQAWLEKK